MTQYAEAKLRVAIVRKSSSHGFADRCEAQVGLSTTTAAATISYPPGCPSSAAASAGYSSSAEGSSSEGGGGFLLFCLLLLFCCGFYSQLSDANKETFCCVLHCALHCLGVLSGKNYNDD